MVILRLVIVIFFFSFNLSHANENMKHNLIAINSILVLGDSLSAAYGIDSELGWVNLLQQRLNEKYSESNKWNIINASVSGETTAGGLARLPKLIDLHQPVLCIIGLGANDGLRGQSTSLMHNHLDQMIQYCHHSGTAFLLGIKLPPNYGDKYTQAFEKVYFDLANQYDIPLIPFLLKDVALEDEYMQNDGLHPTAEAQPIILENVWPTLRKQLDSLN